MALANSLLFFFLFLIWYFINQQRVKVTFREEIISQALIIRDNLNIMETRVAREDLLQSIVNQWQSKDLKVNLIAQPIGELKFEMKKFPPDQRRWGAVTVPLSLRNFSGQLEVARPFTFKSPSLFPYLIIFLFLNGVLTFLFFYFSGRRAREFLFALHGEKEKWQRFLNAQEEIGEIARIVWEKERKNEEIVEKLKEKEQNFQFLISLIEDPCFVLDEKRSVIYANAGFYKLCGVDESSLLSRSAFSLFLKRGDIERFLDQVYQKGEVKDFEFEWNGDFYSARAKIFSSEKKGIRAVCVLNKITEKKRWEKMKQELVAAIGHEIKTPLTAIRGAVETLRMKIRGKSQEFLSVIANHTERLTNTANNLLTLSYIEEIEKGVPGLNISEVNLKKILKNIFTLFSLEIKKKKLKAKLILPKEDLIIKGDPYFLELAFINLLENAINYTDKGRIEIKLTRGLDYAEVAFSDTGIGIPAEDLDKIFERFYVVDKSRSRKTGGSGLGLAIVKHIVNLHQGKIEVKSELGKGSTFTVFLPRA